MKDKLTESLLAAIGEIDDDLIEEATVRARRENRISIRAVGVLAASLAVAIGISAAGRMLGGIGDLNSAPDSSENEGSWDEGDGNCGTGELFNPTTTLYSKNGMMKLTDSGGYRYTFTLVITGEHEPIDALFTLYRDGKESFAVIGGDEPEDTAGGSVIGAPLMYVNGEESNSIPTLPGEYEIHFDLSAFTEAGYDVGNKVKISPFGEFDTIAPL